MDQRHDLQPVRRRDHHFRRTGGDEAVDDDGVTVGKTAQQPIQSGKVAYDGPSSALTPAFLNQIYGAESEELFLPSFDEQTRALHVNGAAEVPAAVAAMKMAIEIERISA